MFVTLLSGFAPQGFMPHSFCMLKYPGVMALLIALDGLIALAYFSIPFGLALVASSRKNLAYWGMTILFAAFILACGITHLFDIWTLWHPHYVAQGVAKAVTAAISVTTAVVLWPALTRELTLPNSRQLAEVNEQLRQDIVMRRVMTQQLEDEVQARRRAEERLQESRQQLKNVLDTPQPMAS
jgi:hypothetical protein